MVCQFRVSKSHPMSEDGPSIAELLATEAELGVRTTDQIEVASDIDIISVLWNVRNLDHKMVQATYSRDQEQV